MCGKKFDVDDVLWTLPNHVGNDAHLCAGSYIMGTQNTINLSMVAALEQQTRKPKVFLMTREGRV